MRDAPVSHLSTDDARAAHRPHLCVITPVYNEAANLDAYVRSVTSTLLEADELQVSILFVDDGSTDGTWQAVQSLCRASSAFSAIRLSRNFGGHVAVSAGLDHVGDDVDAAAILSADLQDPPEVILKFVQAWKEGASVVWGHRRSRRDTAWRKLASSAFEWLIRRYAMPKGSKFATGGFFLVDRRVIQCFCQMREASRATYALVAWTGFDQAIVSYDRQARIAGKSGWSFGRMMHSFYDVVMSFSPLPANLVSLLGLGTSLLSVSALLYLVIDWLLHSKLPGWTGIMATMTFFFGLLFLMVGMMAEYLYRILRETKDRPLYFVAASTNLAMASRHGNTEPALATEERKPDE